MSSTKRTCLICKRDFPKNSLIAHISEHINYKRHKCLDCTFKSVLIEAMVDHQNNTNHRVNFDDKNWYLERITHLIYSDFEYAQMNGEDAIRKFGSVFGDKKRLTEMLRAGETKEEEGDEIEVIATHEVQTPSTHRPVSLARRSESKEQQSNTANVKTSNQCHDTCVPSTVRQEDAILNVQTAAADSSNSNDNPRSQTTEQILVEMQRQITKSVDQKSCKICQQSVYNDYKSQKEHVIGQHMIGVDEKKREEMLRLKLERCFKEDGHLQITNDFQCNICGSETKYKETRYHHVSAVHTDYHWSCVIPRCVFLVRSKRHFNHHLNSWHRLHLSHLEGAAKDDYIMMNNDFELKLTPLVRKCFPFDLPSGGEEERLKNTKKRSTGKGSEDVLADSVISGFMPTVDRPILNRPIKQKGAMEDEFESDDYTDSENESKPENAKDGGSNGKRTRVMSLNSSISKQPRTKIRNSDIVKTALPSSSCPTSTTPTTVSGTGRRSYYSDPKYAYQPRYNRMSEHQSSYRNSANRRGHARGHFYESSFKEEPRRMTKKLEEKSNISFRR